MKPTSEALSTIDKTSIETESPFAVQIGKILQEKKVINAIETGTFKGTGTTKIILDRRSPGCVLYSIEVNPSNHAIAKCNLQSYFDLKLILGNTLPKCLIPSIDSIRKYVSRHEELDIYCDYDTSASDKLISRYTKEMNYDVPYDMLGNALKKCSLRPGLIVLDSCGHIGFIEFLYTIYMLRGSSYIAFDDVNHIKHFESFRYAMMHSEMFEFVASGKEKTGWAIVKYLFRDARFCNMPLEEFTKHAISMYENGEQLTEPPQIMVPVPETATEKSPAEHLQSSEPGV